MEATKLVAFFFLVSLAGCATSPSNPNFQLIKKQDFSAVKQEVEAKQTALQVALKANGSNPDAPAVKAAASENANAKKGLTDQENEDLRKQMNAVLTGCNAVVSHMQATAEGQEKGAFWLSMSGMIAGSVLAPAAIASSAAAHRVFIAAMSGWAGATNTASQTLRTAGLAGDAIATTRNSIVSAMNTAVAAATNTDKSYDERFAALEQVQAACITYSITVPGVAPTISNPSAK
ncbi:hypothetical protein [Ralstonia mojiangensis]|uniref:hypothetical protein n=1 Tax=Ralstonia mojiangensis TaxID=2953895 RepID=UPI00209021ED|nr:hypothetical protein [Ralstonia mojiangensis]MCO5410812.1 hypothetical protein [Ralstonia mojiangensis]